MHNEEMTRTHSSVVSNNTDFSQNKFFSLINQWIFKEFLVGDITLRFNKQNLAFAFVVFD